MNWFKTIILKSRKYILSSVFENEQVSIVTVNGTLLSNKESVLPLDLLNSSHNDCSFSSGGTWKENMIFWLNLKQLAAKTWLLYCSSNFVMRDISIYGSVVVVSAAKAGTQIMAAITHITKADISFFFISYSFLILCCKCCCLTLQSGFTIFIVQESDRQSQKM